MKNQQPRRRNAMHRTKGISRRQKGFTLYDLLFWGVIASLLFLLLIGAYNKGMTMYRNYAINSQVIQIKAGVEDWKGGSNNVTGVSMTELCKKGNGYLDASTCGTKRDGVNTNPYGGNYTVTVSANVSQADITITGIDEEYVNAVANKLAPISAGHCVNNNTACSTIKVATSSVTVTL